MADNILYRVVEVDGEFEVLATVVLSTKRNGWRRYRNIHTGLEWNESGLRGLSTPVRAIKDKIACLLDRFGRQVSKDYRQFGKSVDYNTLMCNIETRRAAMIRTLRELYVLWEHYAAQQPGVTDVDGQAGE